MTTPPEFSDARERWFLAQQHRREWTEMDDVRRAATWLDEIRLDVPGITIRATPLYGSPGPCVAAVVLEWQWRDYVLRSMRHVPSRTFAVQIPISTYMLRDRDVEFPIFEKIVRRGIDQLIYHVISERVEVNHETTLQYVERLLSKRTAGRP